MYNSIGQLDLCQSCQSNEIFSPTEIVGLSRLRFERHWKICASSWATAQPCSAREPLTSRPRQGLSWHFSIGQIVDWRLAKPVPIYFQQLIPETIRVFHQAEKSLQSLWANRDVIAQFICLSSRSSWPHTKATATCSVCTVYICICSDFWNCWTSWTREPRSQALGLFCTCGHAVGQSLHLSQGGSWQSPPKWLRHTKAPLQPVANCSFTTYVADFRWASPWA